MLPFSLFIFILIWWIYGLESIYWRLGLQARNAIAMHTGPFYEWSFETFNCISLAARETRLLSNHPTVLSLRHSLVDAGLTAREARFVQDDMISPKFFGSMPSFGLVCRDLLEVNLWRKTHNLPVLITTSFRGFQGLRYLKSWEPIGWGSNDA